MGVKSWWSVRPAAAEDPGPGGVLVDAGWPGTVGATFGVHLEVVPSTAAVGKKKNLCYLYNLYNIVLLPTTQGILV